MSIKFVDTIITQNHEAIQDTGEILDDFSSSGRKRPWRKRKLQSWDLSKSYRRLNEVAKANRVSECGSFLEFVECPSGHEKRLIKASFCRDRLCPMCTWRKSLLLAHQVRLVCHTALGTRPDLRFIFLTLTAKNVPGEMLSGELTKYFESWRRLSNRKEFKQATLGWIRALEVTHNLRTDEYHPHFHVLIAVPNAYFKKSYYLSKAQWALLWRESMRLDYDPVVDVRVVKDRNGSNDLGGVSAEVVKYSCKPEDYIIPDNEEATDRAVSTLSHALKGRRLVAWGGLLRTVWSNLRKLDKLQDIEEADVDLIHVDGVPEGCTCSVCESDMLRHLYRWHIGAKNYIG